MVEILGANIPVPSFGIGTGKIVWIVVIFAMTITIGITFYLVYNYRLYNRRIVVFENISGQGYQPSYKDTARVINIGDGGEEILFLRKKKVYRSAYGRKMGKNTYWFAVGQDGYWYNMVLGDIDAKMGMLDIEPIDRDMRYMHVAVRKNIQDRYRKKTMEKATMIVVSGIVLVVLIVAIGLWYNLDKLAEAQQISNAGMETMLQIQEMNKQLIASFDNICVGGSGFKSAG